MAGGEEIRCEAMVPTYNGKFVQCGDLPSELHHRLTRARGGLLLDDVSEDYHHIRLCRFHHTRAHDMAGQTAVENGMLLEGYVYTGNHGWPVYVGPDEYLSRKYPKPAKLD